MAAGAGDASGAAKKLLEPPLKTGHSTLDCLDALFADAEEVKFSKDAVVVADGQQQHAVFRVAKGNIRVEKGDSKTTVGQGAVVNRLTAGQLFGEMSFLDSSIPCANCIADSDLELQRLDKASLATKLASNPDLARDFYKHLAISVTQRLSIVSAASAEIPEAPRGAATHLDVAVKGYGMEQLSAAKLLKVRRRLQVGDTVAMTLMMKTTLVNGRSRRQGNLYVFETLVGFVTKAFGIKTHEVFKLSQVHEVLRESFTLKKEEHGIELHMADKHVTFFPVNVEEAYEAIHRCLLQYRAEGSRFSADETTLPSPGGGQRYNNRRGSGLVDANAAFSNNPHGAQALTKSHDARMAEETTTGVFEQLLDQAKCETYKAGDVIIENGTRHCTLFNVASGSVAVQVQRLNEDTQLMEPVKILTLYKGAIFGEMSFLNGDVASATVVAELPCEVYQIKAQDVENMLSDIGKANAAAFYRHLGTYLTHRVRQLTAMVGEALASRVTDIPIEEVLSNGIFFSHFKRFMTEHKLVSPKMLSFLTELNDFLDMPGNLDQAAVAMKLHDKYLVGNPPAIVVPQEALVVVTKALSPTEVPPRDIFGPVLAVALSSLQVNAYRLFSQSSSFQPLLDLKAREEIVPLVSDFKCCKSSARGTRARCCRRARRTAACATRSRCSTRPSSPRARADGRCTARASASASSRARTRTSSASRTPSSRRSTCTWSRSTCPTTRSPATSTRTRGTRSPSTTCASSLRSSPAASRTSTRRTSSTATSSPQTCWSTTAATCASLTWAWPPSSTRRRSGASPSAARSGTWRPR